MRKSFARVSKQNTTQQQQQQQNTFRDRRLVMIALARSVGSQSVAKSSPVQLAFDLYPRIVRAASQRLAHDSIEAPRNKWRCWSQLQQVAATRSQVLATITI